MKRPILIIIGAVLVLILLAVWIYILFFNTSSQSEVGEFTNLNPENNIEASANLPQPDSTINVTTDKRNLLQLTTKPIAGYRELTNAGTTTIVYYIESGTGHIYAINLITGTETQITQTTIALTEAGDITPDGKFAMIKSNHGHKSSTIVESVNISTTTSTKNIPGQVTSFTATPDNTFIYSIKDDYQVIGKEYNPATQQSKTLFTVPFAEATIVWGKTASDKHYVYPKTSIRLEGYGYFTSKNELRRAPIAGYGLALYGNNDFTIYSHQLNDQYHTFIYSAQQNVSLPLPDQIIPEKCTAANSNSAIFICGEALIAYDHQTPDAWYQGDISYADHLWKLDFDSGHTELLSSISKSSGRELDLIKPSISPDDKRLYFINKNDDTLWLYRELFIK